MGQDQLLEALHGDSFIKVRGSAELFGTGTMLAVLKRIRTAASASDRLKIRQSVDHSSLFSTGVKHIAWVAIRAGSHPCVHPAE